MSLSTFLNFLINLARSSPSNNETRLGVKFAFIHSKLLLLKIASIERILHLKNNNFLIAIDDFGSGYSNFQRVIDIDPDFIKIDGSLIKNIENPKFFHTVFAILNFAKSLSADLIAEFVENERIFQIVKMIGIEYSQGYFFSPPLSQEELYA